MSPRALRLLAGFSKIATGLAAIVGLVLLAMVQPTVSNLVVDGAASGVDPARLEGDVRKLAGELSPRDWLHRENLDRAADFVDAELRAAGAKVTRQPFELQSGKYQNVVGAFGPETRDVVVVGAHYDAYGQFPGADDNASGVAVLLELARLLGKEEVAVKVDLVGYTLEEPPQYATEQMGSAVHAAALAARGARVRCMLSLEAVGYYSDTPGSQRFPIAALGLLYPTTGNYVAIVGLLGQGNTVRLIKQAMRGATDLPVRSINALRIIPGVDYSDHRNYWERGWPAVMITDTAFNRNDRYHTASDTPETLDYARMAEVVKGVNAAVLALAADASNNAKGK